MDQTLRSLADEERAALARARVALGLDDPPPAPGGRSCVAICRARVAI